MASLLFGDAHFKTKHGGNQLQCYRMIIVAMFLAKTIVRKYPICFKLRMKTLEQLIAPLQKRRLNEHFQKFGIDYAGPVNVRSALSRFPKLTKAWIVVFIYLFTRAISLELVSDATK